MSHHFFHDVVSARCNVEIAPAIYIRLLSGSQIELKLFGLDDNQCRAVTATLAEAESTVGDISLAATHDRSAGAFDITIGEGKLRIATSDATYVCFYSKGKVQ